MQRRLSIFSVILSVLFNSQNSASINTTETQTLLNQPKIKGGDAATLGEYPYQVAVLVLNRFVCGGSLISDREVITAAHCTFGLKPKFLQVRVGSLESESGGETRTVSQIRQHPLFNRITLANDISIIVLSSPVTLSENVGVVTLEDEEPEEATLCRIAGWGVQTENGVPSPSLQWVDIPITNVERCRTRFPGFPITNQLCLGYEEDGRTICQGDSGSAVVVRGTRRQVGIVSGAAEGPCRETGTMLTLHTNIAKYIGWIRGELRPNKLCALFLESCNRLQLSLLCQKIQLLCNASNVFG